MAAAQGFTEVQNYSFVSEEMARAFSLDPAAHVQVVSPIASDQNLLRTSLLPGIWKNINDNARHFEQFRLFEIGRAIYPDGEVPRVFAAALYRKMMTSPTCWNCVWLSAFCPALRCVQRKPQSYEHPAASLTFCMAMPRRSPVRIPPPHDRRRSRCRARSDLSRPSRAAALFDALPAAA
jgi:hypothetical protein